MSEWALLLATSRCGTRASKRPVAAASQLHNTVAQDRIVTQSLYAVALDRIDNMQSIMPRSPSLCMRIMPQSKPDGTMTSSHGLPRLDEFRTFPRRARGRPTRGIVTQSIMPRSPSTPSPWHEFRASHVSSSGDLPALCPCHELSLRMAFCELLVSSSGALPLAASAWMPWHVAVCANYSRIQGRDLNSLDRRQWTQLKNRCAGS